MIAFEIIAALIIVPALLTLVFSNCLEEDGNGKRNATGMYIFFVVITALAILFSWLLKE